MSDEIVVMRDRRVVERGPTEKLFVAPAELYTRALLAAAVALEPVAETTA